MTKDFEHLREHLVAIHILEEGVSVHSEQFKNILQIDNVLIMGFLSALYNYVFAVGKDTIKFIDFGNYKFIFSSLSDNNLLVLITDTEINEQDEKNLIEKVKLYYEILSKDKPISEISSLFEIKEGILPLEIIADIRKKGLTRTITHQNKKEEDIKGLSIPSIVPVVSSEKFYFRIMLGETLITDQLVTNIKKSLNNFFLGYKKLVACLYAINLDSDPIVFLFGRGDYNNSADLLEKFIEKSILSSNSNITKQETINFKVNKNKYWIKSNRKSTNIKYSFISESKEELDAIEVHTKRISKYILKLLNK